MFEILRAHGYRSRLLSAHSMKETDVRVVGSLRPRASALLPSRRVVPDHVTSCSPSSSATWRKWPVSRSFRLAISCGALAAFALHCRALTGLDDFDTSPTDTSGDSGIDAFATDAADATDGYDASV